MAPCQLATIQLEAADKDWEDAAAASATYLQTESTTGLLGVLDAQLLGGTCKLILCV